MASGVGGVNRIHVVRAEGWSELVEVLCALTRGVSEQELGSCRGMYR